MRFEPHDYQRRAIGWVESHPRCCLFLDMGLGKTVSTLTAVSRMIDDCTVTAAMVVAPKKVAECTWRDEAAKWDHLRHLTVASVSGPPARRARALETPADVYVISRDNVAWLSDHCGDRPPFDMLVLDELTSFKNNSSQRFKAVKRLWPQMARVVGLTGTPSPNGLQDLWAQMYCIDRGERLGAFKTRFMDAYFSTFRVNHIPVRVTPLPGAEEAIMGRLSDICLCMQARDYLTLPPVMVHDEWVRLDAKTAGAYREYERERVLTLVDEHDGKVTDIPAASIAALMNKLGQMANGSIYDDDGEPHVLHAEKANRLAELVEGAGGPVLVFYRFRHDLPLIESALKGLEVRRYQTEEDLRDWNAGRIDVLLAHPASTAYGLNMQQGGSVIVWYGLGWDLELYLQANARLHRQGQTKPVQVYRLLARDTVDSRTLEAIDRKKSGQQALLDGLSAMAAEARRART